MKSVLVFAALTVGVMLLIWGALHLFITRINPAQETPEGHFGESCWACHWVSESARIVED